MVKLNIGCGADWIKHKDFIGLDSLELGQKYVVDLEKENLPLTDESIEEIRAWNILEHIAPERVIHVLNECHRVLKRGGILHIKVPRAPHENAFNDPTHKSFWTPKTFTQYLAGKSPRNANYGIIKWDICNDGHGNYTMEITDRQIDIKLYKR